LKTKLISFGHACWQLFTEVPGWPDAPRWMRVRRVLPLIIPCTAMLLLAGWNLAVWEPHIRAERAAHQPLMALEEEIATLRLSCSQQQAEELAARSAGVAKLLLGGPAELGPLFLNWKKEAMDRHWESAFQAGDASAEAPAADAQVFFLPVRGKLTSPAGNPGAYSALIALLERFSSAEKRIDLTRLAIRADEQGRYAVELNLRLACPRNHEKTAQ
jgi:hypothetical protein